MTPALIIHKVTDYATWKSVFENASDIRKETGDMITKEN